MKSNSLKCLAVAITMFLGGSAFGQDYYDLCDNDVETVSFMGGDDGCQKACDDDCGKGYFDKSGKCDSVCEPCCCGPLWTGRAGAIFMDRVRQGNTTLFLNANLTPQVTDSIYDFDFRAGYEVSLARRLGCQNELEFRFLQIDGWDEARTIAVPPGTLVNVAPPAISPGPGNIINTQYGTDLRSGEINLKRCYSDRITILAGFRWAEINESLAFQFTQGPAMARNLWTTRNNLYGFQLGAEGAVWCCGNFRVDAIGKAGIYANDAQTTARFQNIVNNLTATDDSDNAAFLGEIGVTGTYDITCNISVRAGYQLMYFDGIALASDQVPHTANPSPLIMNNPFRVQTDQSSVLYHGAVVQVEIRH